MALCRTHRRRNCPNCIRAAENKGYAFPQSDPELFVEGSEGSSYFDPNASYGYGSTDYGSPPSGGGEG